MTEADLAGLGGLSICMRTLWARHSSSLVGRRYISLFNPMPYEQAELRRAPARHNGATSPARAGWDSGGFPPQPLVDVGDVLLIAGQAVNRAFRPHALRCLRRRVCESERRTARLRRRPHQGTCSNRRTIRREAVDAIVLDGLQTRLMRPELCDLFCREYAKAMNQLRRDNDAQRNGDRAALKKIDRDLDRLLQAILDGVPGSRLRDKIAELEAKKAELEARLTGGEDSTVLLHPNMANRYRDQISRLRSALEDASMPDASDLIRQLIDRIVLSPVEENGRTSLSIDLHGHIAAILALATNAKKPLVESGFSVSSIKLVAGAGFDLNLRRVVSDSALAVASHGGLFRTAA